MPTSKMTMPERENLLVIVGQLLELSKASAETIKTLGSEIRENAAAVVTATKTLEILEDTVAELNRVVRTGNGRSSLVSIVEQVLISIKDLRQEHANLDTSVDSLKVVLDDVSKVKTHFLGLRVFAFWTLVVISWLVTTGIAFYGVVKR